MKAFFFIAVFLLAPFCLHAQETDKNQFYTQVGMEFDSNVLKTFDQSQGDFLTRILLHGEITAAETEKVTLRYLYNGGGKLFFNNTEQNMLIQSLRIPLSIKLDEKNDLFFRSFIKYQNENDDVDDQNLDVNEDYFYFRQLATWNTKISNKHRLRLLGEFGYFHFYPRDSFSFLSQQAALEYRYQLQSRIWMSAHYSLTLQQFEASERSDVEHEVSAGLHAFIIPYVSLKYHFEINRSTIDLFDSTNHRVTLLLSHLFGKKPGGDETGLFSIHFLTTLQIRNFPSVTAETEEGERFVLTGAEDQYFNQITLKLAYHPTDPWAIEAKYSRFSNAFSSEDTDFARNLYYVGFRYTF